MGTDLATDTYLLCEDCPLEVFVDMIAESLVRLGTRNSS